MNPIEKEFKEAVRTNPEARRNMATLITQAMHESRIDKMRPEDQQSGDLKIAENVVSMYLYPDTTLLGAPAFTIIPDSK